MPTTRRPADDRLFALADVVNDIAHQLDLRSSELRDLVPLTGTEIAVIREVHRRPRCSPSDIADATGLRRSNVSTARRSLEAGGLVLREQAPGNARSVVLVPTEEAHRSVARINQYWAGRLQAADPADLAAVLAALPALGRISAALLRGGEAEPS